jgi:hypothetical protein
MRGIRIASVGVALAVSAAPVFAQTATSATPAAPVATLGRAIAAEDETPVVRGAYPNPTTAVTPLFTRGLTRAQGQPPTGTTLPPPRPVEGQPNVTEQRGNPMPPAGAANPMGPPMTAPMGPQMGPQMGPPMTAPMGPQMMVPMGVPGGMVTDGMNYGGMNYGVNPSMGHPYYGPPAYPNYVVPGGAVIPGPVIIPQAPAQPVSGVVVGPQPCPPGYGAGGGVSAGVPTAGIPVTPSRPSVGVGQTAPSPALQLEDPFFGGYNPAFPRARSAINTILDTPLLSNRLTLTAEYLLWFARAQNSPPLLTTSSPAFNGILGTGDTRVVFGNQSLASTQHSGARFSGIYRLNDCWALDGNVWFLGRNAGEFNATTNQFPLLARPFFDVNNSRNFSQIIAAPGLATGGANIKYDTSLWGAEANLRRALLCGPCSRLDFLLGFRNFNLTESLQITESFARTANSPPSIGVPTALSGQVVDRFRTENHFYGVNLGLAGELQRGWWFVQGRAAVGLGNMYQTAQIDGFQTINTTTGVQQAQGGLLALPGANIGTFKQTKFGVIPDIGLTVGLNLTPSLRLGVGYNFMYANSVVRPANQIDTGLDLRRIPNFPITPTPPAISGVRPSAFPLKTSDFFAQGVTFSLWWTW